MHYNKVIKYALALITVFLLACEKDKSISDDTYFDSKVMLLGHRGMGTGYYKPDNTLESIMPVIGIGADGAEMDIQMTKDSVLVLFHDNTLNPQTTCYGRIYEHTWAEIKECKYYALQNMLFVNSVEELFGKIPNLTNFYFSFDSKIDGAAADYQLFQLQFLRAVQRLCNKYQMSNNVFIEGNEDLLQKAQNLGITNKLFLAANLSVPYIDKASANQFYGISSSVNGINENVEYAHQKGLRIMAWSPNSYSQNKATLSKNVDIIQSDDPISILKLLSRYNYEYIIP